MKKILSLMSLLLALPLLIGMGLNLKSLKMTGSQGNAE